MATLGRFSSEPVCLKNVFLIFKKGPNLLQNKAFFSYKFNRYRERAFRKSSFCSLFLLTILALHLHCLRALFTNIMSYLNFFKITINQINHFYTLSSCGLGDRSCRLRPFMLRHDLFLDRDLVTVQERQQQSTFRAGGR